MKRLIRYFQSPAFTEADWILRDPVLKRGEIAYTMEGGVVTRAKVGPGLWSTLSYIGDSTYDYTDVVTNPIGDANGTLTGETATEILNKMLNPYQVPVVSALGNNAGGTYQTAIIKQIGEVLAGPVLINFVLSNPGNLSGANPIVVSSGVFQNDGNFPNTLPIALTLASPLNPTSPTSININVSVIHTNGTTTPVTTTISFFPKILWKSSLTSDKNSLTGFTSWSSLITDDYESDYDFGGSGYSWLAIPSSLVPTGLVFSDVTNPDSPANYEMESQGTLNINNGLTTYEYSLYRSTYNLISPTTLRVKS